MNLFKHHEKKYLARKQSRNFDVSEGKIIVGYKDSDPMAFYNRPKEQVGDYLIEPQVVKADEEYINGYWIGWR